MLKPSQWAAGFAAGVIVAASLVYSGAISCAPTTNLPVRQSAIDPIATANKGVGDSITGLKTSTDIIRTEANNIYSLTAPEYLPIIAPHTTAILGQTFVQDEISNKLADVQLQLGEANKRVGTLEKDFGTAQTTIKTTKEELAKANDSTIANFKQKVTGWSTLCFFGMIACIAGAIYSNGNKIAVYAGVACAIGLGVCVFLISTVSLIPWIIGALIVVGSGVFIYNQYFAKKKITVLDKAKDELVDLTEAVKPFMIETGRKLIFGDGPVPGKVNNVLLSTDTRQLVDSARAKPTFKKAASVPQTDFLAADKNKDGIVDDKEAAEYAASIKPKKLMAPHPMENTSNIVVETAGKLGEPNQVITVGTKARIILN